MSILTKTPRNTHDNLENNKDTGSVHETNIYWRDEDSCTEKLVWDW